MEYSYLEYSYKHSELQNMILHIVANEGCIHKSLLRKRLMVNPSSLYKAIRSLERKGLVKEFKFNNEKIICINI